MRIIQQYSVPDILDEYGDPVAQWLEACGEEQYIAIEPVTIVGPLAFYTVYTESKSGHPETIEPDTMVTNRTARWVGTSRPIMPS